MIITKSRDYEEIKKELRKKDKIGIISCNSCVRVCGTGGEDILKNLSRKLKKDGYDVVDCDLIGAPCNKDQLQKNQLHGNTQIVVSCEAGIYNLKKIFPNHKIISGLKTIGLGAYDNKGKVELIRGFEN